MNRMRASVGRPQGLLVLLVLALLTSPACAAIEGIFKTGFWAGTLVTLVVVLLIVWLFVRGRS